ncbi:hypothetical protein CIB48_g7950 [Xylaria polymorpha]|nr:hypothetical protein CIB48_g7950 [Xylaria polymorpha]
MRRHIITLVLTTGTLVSTDATRLGNPSRDKDATLLPRRQPGLASGLDDLGSPPEIEFTKRDRTYRYTPRDEDKPNDDDSENESDDDEKRTINMMARTMMISPILGTNHPNGGNNNPTNSANPEGHGNDNGGNNNGGAPKATAIATGVVGALLLILILLLIWYWIMVRSKRRERLRGQHTELPKDSDIESHVTVDLRNGPHTPHDAGSSSDALSSHAMSSAPVIAGVGVPGHVPGQGHPVIFESAARSIPPSPGAGQAEPLVAFKMASATSSPGIGYGPFANAYAVPHPAYGQEQPRSYSPMGGSPQGGIPPGFPPQGRLSPLQIDAFPTHAGAAPTAMELDGRPPPPRYPDAIAASQVPGPSPTSPLPVSPLSVISPHLGPHALTTDELQYHPQQYQGPRQPSYGDYEPSSLPEVVSPICQLGQTSATLPEYDESAEAAWSGAGNHNNLVSQQHQGGDEKQGLSSQQPMPRY